MPNYYAELDEEGKVFAVSELGGVVDSPLMIPITFEQYQDRRLLFTRFVEGKFQGAFARIEADKSSIAATGEDTLSAQIIITDWEGNVQDEYNEVIQVELNGVLQSVKTEKGVAHITVTSDEPGAFVLKTHGLDRNAELKVVVADAG
ncbi:hypothetical protein [Paenibacillus sp. VMFN-D1]|uniref:hypothetical protein n=1 Tax=Paenibacillus sp. VMFN-D1 TaxID=2135608 RepID=UPI000E23EA1C|nr:hypothetical protein [Paenibacillus sp. VMFN-D1]RED40738.1 hypothetical protein C7820_1903 [Paenibacillus sp. VMFN-D1]